MSIWKQILLLALLGLLAFAGYETHRRYIAPEDGAGQAGRRSSGPAQVEVASATVETMRETVEAVGTTRARQSVDIVPEADGRIEALTIAPGDRVEEGTVLIRLDDVIARADLAEAQARFLERDRVLTRLTQLRQSNAVSEAAREEAVARLAEARAQVDRAEQRLAERTILAPFAGTLGLAEVDQGARVSAGTFITRLDDLSEVEIEFSIPETLFSRIKTGMKITATSVAFPDQEFIGTISEVDSRIDPVSRAFRTRAVVPNPGDTLPAGMFMSLELVLSQSDETVVPEEAIVFQAAETYVFAVIDGKARRVTVKTGPRRNGMISIREGLEPGDQVVTRGLHRVRDGSDVDIINLSGLASDSDEIKS
ncbi:efflux RND transporter periplasmic adaptor subunit [Roseovarius nubinhibens]|uniref:Efflux transporter periplasmic adaptor subunit n=1 Tax=Roseovarius nubinhibens TaxID=314263 RepID=A0A348WCF2_9RHOB|nr:efflux transporter periplasmic adaptor subunit [Roseovarius nubinhibens]|tara:strand:- start:1033 stop:2133 length:1101 start_codon:yes stop_codon:yes gene_type:complete